MSPQPDQDTDRSVLSWESVVDASDTETTTAAPTAAPTTPPTVAPDVPSPTSPPASASTTPPTAPPPGDIELTIAPLSLDPLSLDPLPPIGDNSGQRAPTQIENADVLGDVHLSLPPLELLDSAAPTPPDPAPVAAAPVAAIDPPAVDEPAFHGLDLIIAPLDMPDLSPSGRVPSVARPTNPPVDSRTAPPVPAPSPAQHIEHEPSPAVDPAEPTPPPVAAPPVADGSSRPPAAVAGLPDDAVPHDESPTTVIAAPVPAAPAAAAAPTSTVQPANAAVAAPIVPGTQPNQAVSRQAGTSSQPARAEPIAPGRKDRKHQQKLKKQQQKAALRKAKAASQRSGAGGVALFFTLLVLVGLIAGAIIFGRPYLFPDEWEAASRPYGEAVETARGADIAEPVTVQRRAADVFATSMTAHVVGTWETELPTWRSLGLISGSFDAPLLRKLVENWTAAYYEPETGDVIANDAAAPALLDAAIAEAMAAVALDQETGWSSSIDDRLLDSAALTRAVVTASSQSAAAATTFGAADNSQRAIGVSTFLPPVLEYRVNAPAAFAEFSTDDPTQRSADFDALRIASQVQLSSEPELAAGDTLVSAQLASDRTFWYLVFATYADAPTAYAASNDVVQASLAAADSAGTHCTYATFSGTNVAGTQRLSDVLQQWVANAPAAMTASLSTLPTGTMQLRTCDPGVAFESGARFGVGREIARFRSVELAAVVAIPAVEGATADRAAAIAQVRDTQIALPMSDLPFDVSFAQSAEQARTLVAAAAAAPVSVGE